MMETYFPYVGQGVLLAFIGYLIRITTEIRHDVRLVNGRLGKVEEKVLGEAKIGDEREEKTMRRFEQLEP